jgi:hypothetical protein
MNRHARRKERAATKSELVNEEGFIVAFKCILNAQAVFEESGEFQFVIGGVGQDDLPLVFVLRDDQVEGIVDGFQKAMQKKKHHLAAAGQPAACN